MFFLVPAYPGCPGSKAVKRSLSLLLYLNVQLSTCGILILLASLSNILKQLAVFIKKVFSVLSAVGWKLETIQPAPLQSCH